MSRPTSQHRLSVGSNASNLPVRNSSSRSHSHTVPSGPLGVTHRVNRRKSSTFSPPTNPALLGAVEHVVAEGAVVNNRRNSVSRAALSALNEGGRPPLGTSLPHHVSLPERESSSAVVDGPSLSSFQSMDKAKSRMRRASDGTRLTRKEKAASGELKCEHCGKSYKHGSCLNKHLWEHTPQWEQTSKYLISKHQQVQILEAASVLVGMTGETPGSNDSDSSSPPGSGSSDRDEDGSSVETTPPPQADMSAYRDSSKRYSNTSSAYSRSYQSVLSESAPHSFTHHRNWSSSSAARPLTAATSIAESYGDEDPADLAAAVGLLSCSYGTPNQRATALPNDIPPVPPLPQKYAAYSTWRTQHDTNMDDDISDDGHADDDVYMFGKMDA